MDEDLLGYLLGALEPHEMRRVAQWLEEDPEARDQLAEIERRLRPLEESFEAVEPPPADLISRTLDSLPPLPGQEAPTSADEFVDDAEVDDAEIASADTLGAAFRTADHDSDVTLSPMRTAVASSRDSAIRWLDWIGGISAAVVVLGLLLPALGEGRIEARKIACQDQLRELGTSMTQYVNRNQQNRLPQVAASGPEAYAGIYPSRLRDAGLMLDASLRWCPSVERPSQQDFPLTEIDEIVPVHELYDVSVDRLREIQQVSGGHYAYSLGVIEEQQLAPPRFEARSSFAVMSDAPQLISGSDERFRFVGHSGTGINVLYEDGRVRFVPIESLDTMPNHPLLNNHGHAEAGVHVDDAVLAPSYRGPFVTVPQR